MTFVISGQICGNNKNNCLQCQVKKDVLKDTATHIVQECPDREVMTIVIAS